jgi:hypothetical protein
LIARLSILGRRAVLGEIAQYQYGIDLAVELAHQIDGRRQAVQRVEPVDPVGTDMQIAELDEHHFRAGVHLTSVSRSRNPCRGRSAPRTGASSSVV